MTQTNENEQAEQTAQEVRQRRKEKLELWLLRLLKWVGIPSLIILGIALIIWAVWWAKILGVIIALLGSFLVIYFLLAPNNLWFTFVQEGTAKIVVRADRPIAVLVMWRGHVLDEDWNVVPVGVSVRNGMELKEEEDTEGAKIYQLKRGFRNLFGWFGSLWFYGPWPLDDIYIYWFQWSNLGPDGKPIYHPKELLDYILLKEDVYFTVVEDAEDKDRLPLDVELILPVRVVNPYKALFRIQNWLEGVMNRIKPAVRDRITSERYDELIAKPTAIGEDIYNTLEERGVLRDFWNEYGLNLRKIEIVNIHPPEKYLETTLKEFIAKQEAKRVRITANAERYRIRTEGKGEAERVKAVYDQIMTYGDQGTLVRALEALEKSPGEGAKWIIPIPGLADLLGSVFGGKPLDRVPPDEFRQLRELVEKLLQKEGQTKEGS